MTSKRIFAATLIAVAIFATSSCSNPKSSVEYQALETEVEALKSQVQTLEDSIAQNVADAQSIVSLTSEREELINEFDIRLLVTQRSNELVSTLGVDACKSYSTALFEVIAIVDDFGSDYYAEIHKRIRPGMIILGEDAFNAEKYPKGLADYSAALKSTRCSSKADDAFYKTCETVDKKLLNKNPDAFKGKCIKGSARIAQFDSNTGACAFQGYLGGGYDVRAQFGQTLDPNTHDEEKECSWTEELVEDNFIEFYGFGLGSFTYKTSNGGSQTIPAFKMFSYRKG
jgi:hypothetical protein